jgi:hypothetical protein
MNNENAEVTGIALVTVKGEIRRQDGTVEPFELQGNAQLPDQPGQNDEE